ncbi:MAG: hypothetical protein AMS22_00215 [Thiotrichales bacterium SG8_50]|nr:MAG: hypothetical protein AMS22_00215 [Thiotrichales bacterium SG8_50]
MLAWIIYLGLGAFAGTVAGLLGVGGGLIVVPVLAIIFAQQGVSAEHLMHLAVGTSLATIVPTSISSVVAHHRRGAVLWQVFKRLVPGIVVGAAAGALLAKFLDTAVLRTTFGVFELLVAAQLALDIKPAPHRDLPARSGMTLAGTVIGAVSAVLGIGGGTLTVPFLVWCNTQVRQAVATSSACGLPIAIAGGVGFVVTGWEAASELPSSSLGFVYLPALLGISVASVAFAPLGARLAHWLPPGTLKRIFAVFLAILGLRMLLA